MFTFPAVVPDRSFEGQLGKVQGEIQEVKAAKCDSDIDKETLDVLHAAETLVRIRFAGREDELADLIDFIIKKNTARGYYSGDYLKQYKETYELQFPS